MIAQEADVAADMGGELVIGDTRDHMLWIGKRLKEGWRMEHAGVLCPVEFGDSDASVRRIRFPSETDSEKQGQLGTIAGAPREALYLCMRKRGKPAGGLRSPQPFSNRIRHTIEGKH